MASQYAPAEVDQALLTLALNGGNGDRTHEELKAAGLEIPARTLRDWRNSPRYSEIQAKHAPEIRKHAISRFQEGALLNLQLARAASLQALTEAEAGELKDAGKTLQNATIAAGVAVDKALLLNGEPTEIAARFDIRQTSASLARKLGITLDSTATDLPLLPEIAENNARDRSVSSSPD
jgi:hypothetical protein